MATSTRWTMRIEPYDPDARDADNDGIIQEQTAWERPAGTRLVDELGRSIVRGSSSQRRPRGLRVVNERGETVTYTPTYERPGGQFGGGGTPLGEAGAPSLRERGLPTVRDITAPRTVESPEAPAEPAPTPEPAQAARRDLPSRKGKTASEIKEKNKSVLKRLNDRGAKVGKVDKEYKDALQKLVDDKQVTTFVLPTTQDEANARRIETQNELFDGLRTYWETGEKPRYQYEGRLAGLGEGRDLLPNLTEEQLDDFPPELKKLIMESTNEELDQRIQEAAMLIHGDVRKDQISVQLPASRLDQFLADGRYKTTHETVSVMSDASSRTVVEARVMGIPVDADADVRPASGYVILGSAIDAAQRDWNERHGDKNDDRRSLEFDQDSLIEEFGGGAVSSIYGDIRLVMKPEVAERTAYSYGDTIKHQGTGVILMDETDPEVIASVLINGGDMKKPHLQILNMLESGRRGDTIGFQAGRELRDHDEVANWRQGRKFGDPQRFGYRDYMEATILGSFEVGEIEKAYIPQVAVEKQLRAEMTPEMLADVRNEFFSAETLRAKGYSEEEIAYIQGLSDNQLLALRGGTSINKLLTVRKQKEIRKQFEDQGVEVVFQHPASLDPLNTTSYGQAPGGDVEEYLTGLLDAPNGMYQEVQQDVKERIQRELDRAAGTVPVNEPVM